MKHGTSTRARLLVALGSGGLAAGVVTGCAGSQDDDGATRPALVVTAHSDTELSGSYARAGSLITFESRTTGRDSASVQLAVNGFTYDVVIDRAAGTVQADGHDSMIFVEEHEALAALELALGESLAIDATAALHEIALVRTAGWLADAPVGLTFGQRTIAIAAVEVGTKIPAPGTLIQATSADGVETVVGIMGNDGEVLALDDPNAPETLQCQYGNEDGVYRLPGCSGTNWAWAEHDADHCLQAEVTPYGTGTAGCNGRCGINCDSNWNLYTWDCLEHDDCSNDHGGGTDPFHWACGDEYWEASDDWWAWQDWC